MDELTFSDSQLTMLAGKAAFDRGQEYYRNGMVSEWHQSQTVISAEVEGSETYQVELRLLKRGLEGGCDCPASEGIDFCKHCVAVALTARDAQLAQWRAAQGSDDQRIRAYLEKLDRASLIDNLVELIDKDAYQYQRWLLRADAVLGTLDHKALKKRITAALPLKRGLYRYSQVKAYFNNALPTLDTLAEQLPALPPEQGLALVEYALTRLAQVLETMDDSGGFRLEVEETLRRLHIDATQRLDWSADKLAAHLHQLAFSSAEDAYANIPDDYTDILGEDGMAAYHRLLKDELDQLPPLPANASWDVEYYYIKRIDPLMAHAEARNDLDTMLALYAKTAVKAIDCLSAAKACAEHGAWERLPEWLERLEQVSGRHEPVRLDGQRLKIRLLIQRGEAAAAADQLWALYRKHLALSDYQWLVDIADDHALPDDYRQMAAHWLGEQIAAATASARPPTHFVNALVNIHLADDDLAKAAALSHEHPLDPRLLYTVASRVAPDASLPFYRRLAESHIRITENHHYKQAITLLQELHARLDGKDERQAFRQMLGELAETYKAKRNFIKWLREAFPAA